eukprot:396114-Prymnesium_polylepis.1
MSLGWPNRLSTGVGSTTVKRSAGECRCAKAKGKAERRCKAAAPIRNKSAINNAGEAPLSSVLEQIVPQDCLDCVDTFTTPVCEISRYDTGMGGVFAFQSSGLV